MKFFSSREMRCPALNFIFNILISDSILKLDEMIEKLFTMGYHCLCVRPSNINMSISINIPTTTKQITFFSNMSSSHKTFRLKG